MCCCCFAAVNFNWVKPFGYRVSRVFTATNVLLLLVISIDAGRVAGVGGVATGFYRGSTSFLRETCNRLTISTDNNDTPDDLYRSS